MLSFETQELDDHVGLCARLELNHEFSPTHHGDEPTSEPAADVDCEGWRHGGQC